MANDYNVQMVDGAFFANEATAATLGGLLNVAADRNLTLTWAKLRGDQKLGVILVNPNGWTMTQVVRMVVPEETVELRERRWKGCSRSK